MNNYDNESNLARVAYILMIISTVFLSIFIVTLAWMIPMTLATKKRINEFMPSVGLGVCCILFSGTLGFIAGILLLVNNKDNYGTNNNYSTANSSNTINSSKQVSN